MMDGLIDGDKTFTFFTNGTSPHGQKIAILLKELQSAYPSVDLSFETRRLAFAISEQKEAWYLKINPNGRVPALMHHRPDGTSHSVFESAAILLYLVRTFDTQFKFSWDPSTDGDTYSEMLQWIFFSHSGVGTEQYHAEHFVSQAPEKLPYAIDRFAGETHRLYSVLNTRLAKREYLVGPGMGCYSVVDIYTWPWINHHPWLGVKRETIERDFPYLFAWLERLRQRPQVQAGILP